ncbi:geranyl transferase [Chitinimonas arctica]|uniref:Geranyl transferase n=1 Tax=Chitinimonas arctica TaxID=2594795 RepID=A0A516SI75_9NEIS|nr:farnesyl diphosphate synthase [Chitinimonas arctica]QDQ27845.1 geranyl transferase [Chitinimonas arctica]
MKRHDFQTWSFAIQQQMELALSGILPPASQLPQRLHEAMRYAVLGGGKRVRPLLVFAGGELVNASAERLQYAAAAVEMIHAYSLVHDDMPCMDDDVLRRGKPTVHVEFDQATALLAGDALQTAAFEVLAAHPLCAEPSDQLKMLKLLATASGAGGMAGGQAIDLASVGQPLSLPELEHMHILKTGALIRAAVLLGSYCGDAMAAEERERLDRFAKLMGLAFQVVDDILDVEADTATLGKTAGKDAAHDKPTYVSLLGLRQAKERAAELEADAMACLAGFGERAERLRELAHFIVHRAF